MTQAIAPADTDQQIARPLRVLVPLIQEDLQHGKTAAAAAGMPYYLAAGEKLLEAKPQVKPTDWKSWIKRNFEISYSTSTYYMRLAKASADNKFSALNSSSLSEFIREDSNPNYNKPSDWHEPVRKIINRVDTERLGEELKRAEAREAERKLGLQLIDIGYKVLARTLHPDKRSGSREAMTRLNAVRDRLKQHV